MCTHMGCHVVYTVLYFAQLTNPLSLALQDGMSPLHNACYRGDAEVVEILIKAGADVYTTTSKTKVVIKTKLIISRPLCYWTTLFTFLMTGWHHSTVCCKWDGTHSCCRYSDEGSSGCQSSLLRGTYACYQESSPPCYTFHSPSGHLKWGHFSFSIS